MRTETRFTIHGYLVGNIWMPNAECFKHLSYSFRRNKADIAPLNEHATLVDAAIAATNDGDFLSCAIACGELEVKRITHTTTGRVTHTRSFPLSMFPSLTDMLRNEWEPSSEEDAA